jgi:hypothetical protein
MSTTKKSEDDRMQQLQELALETVRLQARGAMSLEEQRRLANNLIDALCDLHEESHSVDSDNISSAPAALTGQPRPLLTQRERALIASVMAAFPAMTEEEVIENLRLWGGI